jgi:Fe-S-cluster-containing dehydrogenase component/CRP-like cAMP-binding protein
VTAADALIAAGRVVERPAGATIFAEGDASDAVFVVIAGAIELRAIRRGDDASTVLRVARAGASFGEEALLPVPRRASATALDAVRLAEVPIAVYRRVIARGGQPDRDERYLRRAAARDLLVTSALGRELGDDDLELLLDGIRLVRFERGEPIYTAGDPADALWLVVDGLVQLQRDAARGASSVLAYLSRGDFFGDEEALAGAPRATSAVAAGDTWCGVVPRELVRTVADRNPGLLPRLRRIAEQRGAEQRDVVGAAAASSTQHVFRDLYRMQMARSLLAIDQDACVRCGHCAWSCGQVHGVSRLVRRGDKVVTRIGDAADRASLLLPNTCQHCRHAACMIDCPTGAIGRDPDGEVFIRPDLCTGCGSCAKACPWENIQIAAGPAGEEGLAEVAVKCEMCRGHEAPACVEACPTGAILRLDPARDVAEVAAVLGAAPGATPAPTPRALPALRDAWAIAVAATIVLGAAGWALAARVAPGHGLGLAAGAVAGLGVLGLAAYAIPKRWIRPRLRPRGARRALDAGAAPRSRTRRHLLAHLLIGAVVPGAALAHAGTRVPASAAGALVIALGLAVVIGVVGAVAYAVVPPALTRLERRGALPEDLAGERDALEQRLYRELSGQGDRVKRLANVTVLPYARARLGWIALVASRRSLAAEEARLGQAIEAALAGRGRDVAVGIAPLVRIAVELRALPARRALGAALGVWLPLHVVTGAMAVALVAVHAATAVFG